MFPVPAPSLKSKKLLPFTEHKPPADGSEHRTHSLHREAVSSLSPQCINTERRAQTAIKETCRDQYRFMITGLSSKPVQRRKEITIDFIPWKSGVTSLSVHSWWFHLLSAWKPSGSNINTTPEHPSFSIWSILYEYIQLHALWTPTSENFTRCFQALVSILLSTMKKNMFS